MEENINAVMIVGWILFAIGILGIVVLSAEGMTFPSILEYDWAAKRRLKRIKICGAIAAIGAVVLFAGILR